MDQGKDNVRVIKTTTELDDIEIGSFTSSLGKVSKKEELKIDGFSLMIAIFYVFVALMATFLISADLMLARYLLVGLIGNIMLGIAVYFLHQRFGTGRYPVLAEIMLKNLGNFFEILIYSFLLSMGSFTLFGAIFIAKSVGDIGKPRNTSNIIAIYRLGLALQIALAIYCAYIFSNSGTYEHITDMIFFKNWKDLRV